MNFKLWGLNILLATAMLVFSFQAYKTWTASQDTIPDAAPGISAKKTSLPKLINFNLQPESVFEDVVRKHLFTEKRQEKIIQKQKTPPKEVKIEVKTATISGKKIILYGVIIMDDVKIAMIKNPARKAGDPEYLWVREGEKLHNLRIKAIQPDRILLTEKGKNLVVLLHDQTSPENRAASSQTQKKLQAKKTAKSKEKPQAQHIAVGPVSSPAKAEDSSAEYETITTPFGTFKRKKK